MNNVSARKSVSAALAMALVLATSFVAGAAHADTVSIHVPSVIQPTSAPVTRAEVRADLAIWVASGLQKLDREYDGEAQINSAEYAKDFATYTYLRSSPQFAMLVGDFERGDKATVVLAHDPVSASIAQR
jgi:hypothetical protein